MVEFQAETILYRNNIDQFCSVYMFSVLKQWANAVSKAEEIEAGQIRLSNGQKLYFYNRKVS